MANALQSYKKTARETIYSQINPIGFFKCNNTRT